MSTIFFNRFLKVGNFFSLENFFSGFSLKYIILFVSSQLSLKLYDPTIAVGLVSNRLFSSTSTCNKPQLLSGQWITLFKK